MMEGRQAYELRTLLAKEWESGKVGSSVQGKGLALDGRRGAPSNCKMRE